MACTYRMKDAAGAWQTISGKPAMMAALAEGRLDHLLPAGTVAAMNGESSSSGAQQQDETRRSEMDQPDEEASADSLPVRIPSIPLDIATRAFMGTSHSPERRGQAAAAGFRSEIESLWQRFEPAYRAATPERQAAFVDRFNEIADRYGALTRDYLSSHGQVMSTMIAGPAKFPTERNRKRSEAADNKARQAAEYMEKAPARLQKALSGPVDNSVSAALEAAKAKLAEREKLQAQMKATNAALRKGDDEALRGLGYSDAQIADLKKPDFAGRTGIPGYMLTNNNAEIRRQRERIAELEQREIAAQTQTESDENVAPGVRMVKSAEAGRLQLFFDGKPSDAVRDDLKAAGFRWAPSTGAWQRQLTGNAELAAQGVIRKHIRGEAAALAAQNANTQDAAAEEAQRVQAAIEGKGLIEAARFLTQSADKAKAAVASAVLNKLERLQAAGVKLELNIAHRGDMVPAPLHNSRGYTETAFDEKGRDIAVWINGADVAGKVGADEETLLHELVHAATTGMVFYGKNRPDTLAGQHVRALMAVTDAIAAHISQRFEDADAGKVQLTDFELDMREGANNAFRSDDEVLAWALSSRDAQTYLEGIPYKSGSLWSRFVSAVRVMLGLSPQQDTALSEVLAVAESLMTDDAPEMGRAAFWHKRGMRMVQQQGQGSIVQTRQDSKAGGDEAGATAQEPPGITAESLPSIFSARFPKLAGAVAQMMARGERGQKGGLVVLDTNDEVEIAREFAERTGRSFDDTVQMFESGDGQYINAFYDPASGLTFLIGPNLTADSAPALVMHEAVHGQQRERVNAKALALIDGRADAATPALRAFLDRVAERMDLVGEAGNAAEAASYIVELAVKEGRSGSGFSAAEGPMLAWIERNIGKPVADIVRDFVATVRAWALAHGVPLKAVSVDDLVAYAQAGVRKAAKGRVLTTSGGQEAMSKSPETLTAAGQKDIQFSRSGTVRAATRAATSALNSLSQSGQASLGTLTADQQATVDRVFGKPKTLTERAEAFAKDWKKNLVQGVFDQFAPIKDITSKGYMLARLAKGGDSTLEALMMYGKVSVDADGVYKVDFDGKNLNGFAAAMAALDGEHDRFLAWVSGQRADRLAKVGLENLMTPQDIASLKTLADGTTASGKVRRALYAETLKKLNAFNDSVLKIAADSGLIDEATRKMYQDTPYIPFYRLSEEDVVQGPSVSKGLVNQSAWKQLKGGTDKLNEDLMGNLLKNWSHLITASANNRAAKEVLDAAARMGAATDMTNDVVAQDINGHPIYRGNTKGLVRYRGEIKRKIPKGQPYVENGQTLISDGTAEISYVGDRYFKVDDPHLMDAIASIGFTTKVWKPMADFKRYLTFGVTVNPTFKIRNLIRDSIQAVGTAELSYNPVKNILMGAKGTELMSTVRAQMLASGGMLRFGSSEGAYSGHVRRLIEKGVDPQYILDDDNKIKSFWKHKVLPAFEAYQELGDRSENVNRAALYEQLLAKGMSHAEASFWARDMMDFSMHGKWAAIRTLTAVVPFMNARLQGIYKLGRATKADYRRMGATLAAVSLASMALLLAYDDDDDWKKREDWDRDNSWWFKIGDTAFRIPKPFEVGAVGTIAERSLELMISDEMTGKRFGQRMRDLLMQNLSMNPTPQLIKPMIDLYANKDGFSGRDIETQGMEKLRPEDRYTARTSEVARFLGQLGLPNPAQLLMGRVEGLSPVQIDHLIRGYFAWVGTSATNVLDRGIRPLMDRGEKPDMRLRDVFLAGNFMESLPSGSSRYVTQFYEQAKEIEQMYASYRQALKEGDAEKAQGIHADNTEAFAARRRIESAKRAESLISGQMRAIERNKEMSGDEKRARLDQLEKRRDDVARRALLVPAAPGRD